MKTLSKEQHEERRRQREFAMEHAEPGYRTPLQRLHQDWTDWNVTHFGGKLVEPHIGFGRTAPRSLGHCSPTTKYGGRLDITLNEGLFFGPNRDWIIHPLPAEAQAGSSKTCCFALPCGSTCWRWKGRTNRATGASAQCSPARPTASGWRCCFLR